MEFVDLARLFVPLKQDEEVSTDWGPDWGRKYGGWLNWEVLSAHPRVVLLAEALSGKTEELRHRAKTLRAAGEKAFFVAIEELADDGIEATLSPHDRAAFEAWTASAERAWLFLDSVDEARLSGKKLRTALRKFSSGLPAESLQRLQVVVSCRASDWRGREDRLDIEEALPFRIEPPASDETPEDAFLSAYVDRPRKPKTASPSSIGELLVVRLAPLDSRQQILLAEAGGVSDARAFLTQIGKQGLDVMAERPGDLVDLIEYWRDSSTNRTFGSLEAMTEGGVTRKLRDDQGSRAELARISGDQARLGAERLAAGLALAKTLTIKAARQEADPTLAAGALDARDILGEWDPGHIVALLNRGIFAPATYGRIRFHHRSTLEYLAARWFHRLLVAGAAMRDVADVLFVERYGVKTVVPALRPIAAWLALWHPEIRDEIAALEPRVLITHGDAKSLPLAARGRLLETYAALHVKGATSDASLVGYRAAWMFSSPDLGDAVRKAWVINAREDFRCSLLLFIEEGPIPACQDLAEQAAITVDASDHVRTLGARALLACKADEALRRLAKQSMADAEKISARLAPELALTLVPGYMSAAELVEFAGRTVPARPFEVEGFASSLVELHARAGDRASKRTLAAGMAALCLAPPHAEVYPSLSDRYQELSKGMAELALAELKESREDDLDPGLLLLLQAVERARDAHDHADQISAIAALVRSRPALNRALMWADFSIGRSGAPRTEAPTRIYQVAPLGGSCLWDTGISELPWLIEDCKTAASEPERRVAFNAILVALMRADQLATQRGLLDDLAAGEAVLAEDLAREIAYQPPPPDPGAEEYPRESAERREREREKLLKFRRLLLDDPTLLSAPDRLTTWKDGQSRLYDLYRWLASKAREAGLKGIRHLELVRQVFSDEVATQFVAGMHAAWRVILPQRPVRHSAQGSTGWRTNELALTAIELESGATGWDLALSNDQVAHAVRHACFEGHYLGDWLEHLLRHHATAAMPVILEEVDHEYAEPHGPPNLLIHASQRETVPRLAIASRLLERLQVAEPVNDEAFKYAMVVLCRCAADLPHDTLGALADARIQHHLAQETDDRAWPYLAVLGAMDPDSLARRVVSALAPGADDDPDARSAKIRRWMARLFEGLSGGGLAVASISRMSPALIAELCRLAFGADPTPDESSDDNSSGRNSAKEATNTLFNALLSIPGQAAFEALQYLARDPVFASRATHFNELAHAKAAADGELIAWTPGEIVAYASSRAAPVKTGCDLLQLVMALLVEIQDSFAQQDFSSRAVLENAPDEKAVQPWLAEQLQFRARGRFRVYREPEVVNDKKPDIVISSTSAEVHVAVEIKHGNMAWSMPELEAALTVQLAEQYLAPHDRRQGVLVITLHGSRSWRPAVGMAMDFSGALLRLAELAKKTTHNAHGRIEVRVAGLDARPPAK